MTHLSDDLLNEYLDEMLSPAPRRAVAGHLAACPECAARLDGLRALFADLAALPEQPLGRDLSGEVVDRLTGSPRLPRAVHWTLLVQALVLVGGLVAAWPLVAGLLPAVPSAQLPSTAELLARLAAQWTAWAQTVTQWTTVSPPSWQFPLSLDVSGLLAGLILAGVTLLWLVGNGVLLRAPTHSLRRRHP